MNTIEIRVQSAQTDPGETEQLMEDYLPFIKKQITGMQDLMLEYDDMLSLAMLTFLNCIRQYSPQKGNFLSFCKTCIKNRLIDEGRKQMGYRSKVIAFEPKEEEEARQISDAEAKVSWQLYEKDQERNALSEEIRLLSDALDAYGIRWEELPRICPKQERSRKNCLMIARAVVEKPDYKKELLRQHRLPQADLAAQLGVSAKTIEKHRKYIITLAILLMGDYPGIRTFLPKYREVN